MEEAVLPTEKKHGAGFALICQRMGAAWQASSTMADTVARGGMELVAMRA